MAQRCSYCGRTKKQHKGKPCVDLEALKKFLPPTDHMQVPKPSEWKKNE